jgi:hypothetical protein
MKSQFTDKEFQQMIFNPIRVPDGSNVLVYYKDLAKHKEFRLDPGEGIDNNKLLLYIFCLYDKNSPYKTKYNDFVKRKIEVAHDVGFEENKEGKPGSFMPPVEDFIRGKNKIVNKKIVEYVRMHRSFQYSYLVTIESSYYSLMADIIGGSTRQLNEAKTIKDELETTMLDLLNQDKNPAVRDELLRYMEDERLELRPEDIAQKLQDGKSPISITDID